MAHGLAAHNEKWYLVSDSREGLGRVSIAQSGPHNTRDDAEAMIPTVSAHTGLDDLYAVKRDIAQDMFPRLQPIAEGNQP